MDTKEKTKIEIIGIIFVILSFIPGIYWGKETFDELRKYDINILLKLLAALLGGSFAGSIWPLSGILAIVNETVIKKRQKRQKRRSLKHSSIHRLV